MKPTNLENLMSQVNDLLYWSGSVTGWAKRKIKNPEDLAIIEGFYEAQACLNETVIRIYQIKEEIVKEGKNV